MHDWPARCESVEVPKGGWNIKKFAPLKLCNYMFANLENMHAEPTNGRVLFASLHSMHGLNAASRSRPALLEDRKDGVLIGLWRGGAVKKGDGAACEFDARCKPEVINDCEYKSMSGEKSGSRVGGGRWCRLDP